MSSRNYDCKHVRRRGSRRPTATRAAGVQPCEPALPGRACRAPSRTSRPPTTAGQVARVRRLARCGARPRRRSRSSSAVGEAAVAVERRARSRSPSGPSARTQAATLPRTRGVGVPSRSRSAISTLPSLSVTRKRRSGASPSASTTSSTAPLEPGRRLEQPGREAEDRADVDVLARAGRAPRPVVAPAGERAEHGHQLARALGQLVVDARRHLAVALAGEQAVGDHAVEARAQLLGRDPREHALELDEATRARGEVAHDQQRPLVADEVERPRIRRPLVIRMTLGGRRSRDEISPDSA